MRNLRDEILAASPSQPVVYHKGYILKGADPEKIMTIRKLYDEGEIELTMRRATFGTFEFRAHKRSYKIKRPVEHTFHYSGMI